ncbi:MAG: TolC family protein [Bacteroidetes bacterium]|nr:TolC family protein [Bacteroidota bacterium]
MVMWLYGYMAKIPIILGIFNFKHFSWYLLPVALSICNIVSAQEESKMSFSLEEALNYAVKNNHTIKNAALDAGISKSKVKEITATGFPQLNGEINYQNFIDLPTSVVPAETFGGPPGEILELQFGTSNNAYAKITARQLLFDGTYIVGLQAAKVYLQLSMNSLIKSQIEVKDLVSQTYYMVLVAEENEKILTQNHKNIKSILDETKVLNKNGFVDDIEVEQLELTLSNLFNSLTKIKGQVIMSYRLLNFQMGIDVDQPITLKDSLKGLLSGIEQSAESPAGDSVGKELDVENHIDLVLVTTQESLMALNLKKEKFARMPTLGAFATHSQNTFSNSLEFPKWYPTTIWGINVSIPIFDSYGQSSRIRQARFELEKIQNQRIQMEQNLRMQAGNAQIEFNTAYTQSKIEGKNMKLAKKILDKTIVMHKEGIASSTDVTVANNQYLTTQGNYYSSIFELLKSKSKLDKALNSY